MNAQTQHILGVADSAHQGIELARSLLQESLGNMGEILTLGCVVLGPASLGSTMRLGEHLKQFSFLLVDLLTDAQALCILLGRDLGVCEGESTDLAAGELVPKKQRALWYKSSKALEDALESGRVSPKEYFDEFHPLDDDDLTPGEDEFDDDEQPF